jgi:tetratricopeptide (TPR) repeat protein
VNEPSKPYFTQALDALKQGERRAAAVILERQIRLGNTSAKNLGSVAQLAEHIGEVALAIEARRLAIEPGSIDLLLPYWAVLATYGRGAEALAEIERQPAAIRDAPEVLHFRGTVASQFGRGAEAEDLFRRALAKAPTAMQTWFALAMLKSFAPGDPDIAAMERLERHPGAPSDALASLYYALGKAAEDCGDIDLAFAHFARGAALRRAERPIDTAKYSLAADVVIRDFTTANLMKLEPSLATGATSAEPFSGIGWCRTESVRSGAHPDFRWQLTGCVRLPGEDRLPRSMGRDRP